MFGELTALETEQLLSEQIIGRIGCSGSNTMYVVPVSYAYDGVYIYGHTHEGKKINMMRNNPEICFEVDDLSNLANWKSVICWGTFEELIEPLSRTEAIKILTARKLPIVVSATVKLFPEHPFNPQNVNALEGIVYRLKLTRKTGRFERYE